MNKDAYGIEVIMMTASSGASMGESWQSPIETARIGASGNQNDNAIAPRLTMIIDPIACRL